MTISPPRPAPSGDVSELAAHGRLLHGFDAFVHDAGAVLDPDVQPNPYNQHPWLARTAAHIQPDAPLVTAAAYQGEHALWLPVRDCGGGEGHSFASWYTLAYAPIFSPHCPEDVRATLIPHIARQLRKAFTSLHLWPMEPEDAAALSHGFRAAGWLASDYVDAAHWVAHTKGVDFATYWARRGSKLRNTVRRRGKAHPVETRIFRHFDAQAWAAYEAIYAQSWKPAEGSPAFLRAYAMESGAAGRLRLGLALRDGVPVAAQFWTLDHGVATIHKLAHIESERAQSPGTLLSHAMFQHVLDQDHPVMIDYGNGDEPYKAEWMDERRVRHRLRLLNPYSLRGISSGMGIVTRAVARRLGR